MIVLKHFVFLLFFVEVIFCMEEDLSDTSLYLSGQNQFYPLEKFTKIMHPNVSSIEYLTMKNLDFDPNVLTSSLKPCILLESIELRHVTWSGFFKEKLYLPNIRSVRITRNQWRFTESSPSEFLSMFFFSTASMKEMTNLSVVIRSDLDGSFIYFMSELHVEWIPYDVQQYFSYNKLEMENSVIDVTKVDGSELKKIKLTNVTLTDGSGNELLRKLTHITDISLRDLVVGRDGNRKVEYDFSLLPVANLKSMGIEGGVLYSSLGSKESLYFKTLRVLELKSMSVDSTGFEFPPNRLEEVDIKLTTFLAGGFEILGRITSLRHVGLSVPPEIGGQDLDLSIFVNSSDRLSSMSLENFLVKSSSVFKFPRLGSLFLTNVKFDSKTTQYFSQFFTHVESVFMDNKLSDDIFKQLLNTSVRDIYIDNASKIRPDNMVVRKFLNEAKVPLSHDSVQIRKEKDGNWSFIGETDDEISQGESAVFNTYVISLFIICLLGITGNLVSIVVLAQKSMRSSSGILLITLALFDITILATLIGSLFLYGFKLVSLFLKIYQFPFGRYSSSSYIPLLGRDPVEFITSLENVQAKYIYPLTKTAHTGSVYMTIVLTLERFLAVCYPLRVKVWASKDKAIGISVAVLLLAFFLNSPRWFETKGSSIQVKFRRNPERLVEIVPTLERVYTEPNILQQDAYRVYYHRWGWTVVMYGIPIPLLSFLNVKIWLQIRKSLNLRKSLTSSENEVTSLTAMLLTISSLFVISNALNGAIIGICLSIWSYDPRDIEVLSCIPVIINSSINFIIYALMGKKFRKELVSLLHNCSSCRALSKKVNPRSVERNMSSRSRPSITSTVGTTTM